MKIAVLLSGGVDSSVVLAKLASEKKHDLTAFYLKIWLEDELQFLGECPWEEDLKYARAVCEQWGVPLKIIPLQQEYNDRVVQYTIKELREGRTPSPDIFCNQRVKFGAFLDHIDDSFEKIATGHYADTVVIDGVTYLKQAADPIKDQTYFLSHLSQEQLSRCLFPLGPHLKQEVRSMAKEFNLPTMNRPDSQGICFLGKIKYNDFVKYHLGESPGEIREWESKRILGKHHGLWFHTFGQRKGIGLHGGPWFVVDKDLTSNTLYVSHSDLLESVARKEFKIEGMHWLSRPIGEGKFDVKIRHGQNMLQCTLSEIAHQSFLVKLSEPDAGLANGQFAVFYRDGLCLGSGMIRLSI